MKLYFIRHGISIANDMNVYCGSTDVSLSDNGIASLKKLKDENIYPKEIDCFYTSKLKRTIETLSVIYPNLQYTSLEEINEVGFGIYEMKSHDELKSNPEYIKWLEDKKFINFKSPGGENIDDVLSRLKIGMNKIFTDIKNNNYENIAIITHGGIISVMMNNFYQEHNDYYGWLPKNGRGFMLEFDDPNNKAISYKEI